jgi:hypothetical protein
MSTTNNTKSAMPALIVFGTPKGAKAPHAACVIIAIAAAIAVSLVRDICQHEQIDQLQAENAMPGEQLDWFSTRWHDKPPVADIAGTWQ